MPHPPLEFRQVDVFTRTPLLGNPVAVVFDAAALDDGAMQAVARWTNLSETTFVLPPSDGQASYRLRIFTPDRELPFAGHPTLGSAHALLEAGRIEARGGLVVQECAVGRIPIRVGGPHEALYLKAPAIRFETLSTDVLERTQHAIGARFASEALIVDLGPRWLTARISSDAALLALAPDMAALVTLSQELRLSGVNLYADAAAWVEVRSFAPAAGVPEDPVCGSGNVAVAALRRRLGDSRDYDAHQGQCRGRDGRIAMRYEGDDAIWLGGSSVTCIQGTLML